MRKKLNKNFGMNGVTVESMSCKMVCECNCGYVCMCNTTSDYYGFTAKPEYMEESGKANTDFNLEWTIQAL